MITIVDYKRAKIVVTLMDVRREKSDNTEGFFL